MWPNPSLKLTRYGRLCKPGLGTWCIITGRAYTACLRGQLSSNVRPHVPQSCNEALHSCCMATSPTSLQLRIATVQRSSNRICNLCQRTPISRICGPASHCSGNTVAGPPRHAPPPVRPNPSVNLTRYGRLCKPGLRYAVHSLIPGLQSLPPRAGYLER